MLIMELRPSIRLACWTCCLILVSVAVSVSADSHCSPSDFSTGSGPQKPKLDFSYTAQIYGKWIHNQRLGMIYENYDAKTKKMSIEAVLDGGRWAKILDLKSKTSTYYYYYNNQKCSATDLPTLTYEQRAVETFFSIGTVWKYMGRKYIRGINVQQWRSCSTSKNFTTDQYYTESDNKPYRMELKGVTGNFHVIYDYFLFTRTQPDPSAFLPIPGIVCGSVSKGRTPGLPLSATFKMLTIDSTVSKVTSARIAFDKQKNVFSEEYTDKINVYDYNIGIRYEIMKLTGQCSKRTIKRFQDRGLVDNAGRMHMATLRRFLFDDGNFTTNGVRVARGIPCDVFTKTMDAADELSGSMVEIYTARKDETMINNQGNLNGQRQPIRVVLKRGRDNYDMVINKQYEIYDFDPQEHPYNDPFDLSPCFDESQTVKFMMTMGGQVLDVTTEDIPMFKTNTSLALSQALGINLLRVWIQYVSSGDSKTVIEGSIFDQDPPSIQFQVVPQMVLNETIEPGKSYTYANDSNSPMLCADYCTERDLRPSNFKSFGVPCFGFEFDRRDKSCTFYDTGVYSRRKEDENLKKSRTSDYYRYVGRSIFRWQSDKESFVLLQRLVSDGLINVTDNHGDVFKATSVSKIEGEEFDLSDFHGEDSPIKQFVNASAPGRKKVAEYMDKIYLGACARHCLSRLTYNCEGFQYNAKDLSCAFFEDMSSEGDSVQRTPTESYIHIYRLNYRSYFEKFPGRSMLPTDSGPVYTSIKDGNACAELCVKESSFFCQSFEMCDGTCLLGRKHISNTVAKVKQVRSCDHYSRAYIQDYTETKNLKALKSSGVVERVNIGAKDCAALCSTSPSLECDAFEYCVGDSICRLATKSIQKSKLVYTHSGYCNLYKRKNHRERAVYSASKGSNKNGSHSPGAMGGVAIGMILVGVVLLVIGVFVFSKFRGQGRVSGGMSVGFSRSQMADS